jgi:spermidine dehydrogenase
LRILDTMTQEDRIIKEHGISRETIRTFVAPLAATGYGLGCDALSGRLDYYWYHLTTDDNLYSFPGGNAAIARHELKALIPDALPGPVTLENIVRRRVNFSVLDLPQNPVRMRLSCAVVRVEHEREPEKSDFVYVTYTRLGRPYRLRARSVVMACQGVFARHVIRDLPPSHHDAYSKFCYAPHLSLNVAVRNWRFLHKLGISGARWFDSFGLWTEVRNPMVCGYDKKTFGPASPTVVTLYVPFMYPGLPTEDQGNRGRFELLSTPFREFERKVRIQFVEMFSRSGFDPRRDIAGIVANRWGHAFITAAPGFFYGRNGKLSPREVLRNKPFGRIAFGHSDIGGEPEATGAIAEATRAAKQLISILG